MATQSQTAELILQLKDQLSGNAATAIGKIEAAERNLLKQAESLAASTKLLDSFAKLDEKAQATTAKLNAQQQALNDLTAKMGEDPSKKMVAAFDKAQAAVQATTDKLKLQQTALNDLTTAFEGKSGGPFGSMAEAQDVLRKKVDDTTAAIRAQMTASTEARQTEARNQERRKAITDTVNTVGVLSGPVILQGTYDAAKAGAEVQHERVEMAKVNIPPAEIEAIEKRALELATLVKNVSQSSLMKLAKEARSVTTTPEDMLKVLEPLAKAKSVLDARDPSGAGSENLTLLVKGAENLGAAKDPERLAKLIDAYVKGMQVMGKTISPETIFDFDKNARQAGAQLSDRFLMTTALSLSQEMNGQSAGKAVNQLRKFFIGGLAHETVPTKELVNLGLIDPKDVRYNKTGEVSGVKAGVMHPVKGDTLLEHDPDKWVYDYLLPAMEKHGITNREDQLALVTKLLPGTQAADLVSKLITQRESYEAHGKYYDSATGSEGYKLNAEDPIASLKALTTSLQTFAGVLTSPGMAGAAHALDYASGIIATLSTEYDSFAKAHPEAAAVFGDAALAGGLAVGGKLTYNLFDKLFGSGGGAALGESAMALDASATALNESALTLQAAAGRLGVGGAPAGPGTTAAEGGAVVAAEAGAPALVLPEVAPVAAAAVGLIGAAAVTKLVKESFAAQQPGMGGQWAAPTDRTADLDRQRLADQKADLSETERQIAANSARSRNPDALAVVNRPLEDRAAELRNQIANLERGLDGLDGATKPTGPSPAAPPALPVALNPPNPIVLPARPHTPTPDDALRSIVEKQMQQEQDGKSLFHRIFGENAGRAIPVSFTEGLGGNGFEGAVARGTEAGFRNVLAGYAGADEAGGGGGGLINASYETDAGGGGGSSLGRGSGSGGRGRSFLDTPGVPGRVTGSILSRGDDAMAYLQSLGVSREAAAAITGNAQQESSITGHGLAGDHGSAHGMFQWRFDRFDALQRFAAARGKAWQDEHTELAFAVEEAKRRGHAEWLYGHDVFAANLGMKRFEQYRESRDGGNFRTRLANAHLWLKRGPAPVAATDPATLPRKPKPAATPPAPPAGRIEAMNAAPEVDSSGIHEAIHHVRTLKAELASLGEVGIDVKHRGFSGSRAGGAGSIRSALNNGFSTDGRHWT